MGAREVDAAAIFNIARKIHSAQARADYLEQVCGRDGGLRDRLQALLEAHEQNPTFLQTPLALIATAEEPVPTRPGATIGPYKLIEQIGEGGFGLVFMAEQQRPVRRKVAVKVLKPGMDSRQVVARFEAERQALALMDHVNIARVLEAGETTTGRPYFAMELVRGVPITDYCDKNCLRPRERLQLFITVCQAVQHAHQKGIIHRDIKPSNVLVTLHDGTPVVKVIDFGIAKALGQQLTDKTLCTAFAHLLGTPLYMSPEQAEMSGLDVDTRSDIYSLGVLLYELLTGATPFDKERLRKAGYDEMRRIIREEEPPRPSKRLSSLGAAASLVSAHRQSDPRQLSRLFRGELDWIVMKALEKDRNRRYEMAGSLAADVQRYLNDEPVWACPPSSWYRLRKFARRHRWPVSVASALLLLLAMATAAGVMLRERVDEQRKAAYAAGLVLSLGNADTGQVPSIVAQMAEYRKWTDPLLREKKAISLAEYPESTGLLPPVGEAAAKSRQQLHISLALLPVDPTQVRYLKDRLLTASPQEVPVIRDALLPHRESLRDELWMVAQAAEKGKEPRRLRAAAALAEYDRQSENWAKVQSALANDLVRVPSVYLGLWMDALRPVRKNLLSPLAVVYRDGKRRETERSLAAEILADFAADQPQLLADLLMEADENQFGVIYPRLREQGERGLATLIDEIDRKLPPDLPSSSAKREKLAKRQANAAVAVLRMGQGQKVWPLLKHTPDPRVRSYLIHRLSAVGADPGAISKRLDVEPDVTVRRALLLSLGEFDKNAIPAEGRSALLPKVQRAYCDDPDPGLHAAAEWLLRQWQQENWLRQVNNEWAKGKERRAKRPEETGKQLASAAAPALPSDPAPCRRSSPRWYVNGQGLTMIVIPGPVDFVMGSPPTEEGRNPPTEPQHHKRISRTFAVSAKPVTMEQYRQFNPTYGVGEIEKWAPTVDGPVAGTDWFQAAAYCNWLSRKEGLPESEWCYQPLFEHAPMLVLAASSVAGLAGFLGPLTGTCGAFPERTDPQYKPGMQLAPNYLHRTGYRLPTEAEMEYSSRSGATSSRYFGETPELLNRYALYLENSYDRTWPVASKKPNDLGFFDVLGNAFTWCQEPFADYPQVKGDEISEDNEGTLIVLGTSPRVLRGGSFANHASSVRCADRYWTVPTVRNFNTGFRVARTLDE
jgi:serine/threonine protein kinase/formylglycine-generating enzyme required for sulfatase activity